MHILCKIYILKLFQSAILLGFNRVFSNSLSRYTWRAGGSGFNLIGEYEPQQDVLRPSL